MSDRADPPWPELDDGIRETVRALWNAGFAPTDSGDGVSKPEDERSVEFAHVFMVCEPGDLVQSADRLARLVADWPRTGDYNGNVIEASYSPSDGIGVIALVGVVAP